jgi:hypothetical protein
VRSPAPWWTGSWQRWSQDRRGEKARAQHTATADKGRPITKKRKGEKSLKSAKSAKNDSTAKGILTAAAVENVTQASQVQSATVVVDPTLNTQEPNSQVPSPAYSQVSPSEEFTFSYDQSNNVIIPPSLSANAHPQAAATPWGQPPQNMQGSSPWGQPPTQNIPTQGTAPWGLPPTHRAQSAPHAQGGENT